jgi:hypothetical protein
VTGCPPNTTGLAGVPGTTACRCPTYGATVGDQLSFWCFCDGQDTLTRLAQPDAVRLSWGSVKRLQRSTDAQLEAILASIGAAPADLPPSAPAQPS